MKPRQGNLTQMPTWMVTLGIALAAVAYAVFVFLPFQRGIANLSRQLKEKRLHVVQADQIILPLARERKRLAGIHEHTQRWQQQAPDPQQLAAFYARLSEQARQTDVQLVKFEPQPPKPLQSLRQYSVVMSIHGDFPQLYEFLSRLEQLPQTVWPTHLRLAQPDAGNASLTCDLTLTFFGDLAGSAD